MKPDASTYNPSPEYLNDLIISTGLTQPQIGKLLGYDDRQVRRWLSGQAKFPYVVQFALECLVLEV